MSDDLKNKLYMMEVQPPAEVWTKLSVCLDEINADNAVSRKIYDQSLQPLAVNWESISARLKPAKDHEGTKKGIVLNLKRFAVAAVFAGVILAAWLLFRTNTQKDTVVVETKPLKEKIISPEKTTPPANDIIENNNQQENVPVIAQNIKLPGSHSQKRTGSSLKSKSPASKEAIASISETPGEKIFTQQIDDLSMVADGNHYVTMVNANGRLVKIPATLAHLAPRLQDKPLNEDYSEVMFGEGAYWQETLADWRKKLASAPIASGDNFGSFIELLKLVQDR